MFFLTAIACRGIIKLKKKTNGLEHLAGLCAMANFAQHRLQSDARVRSDEVSGLHLII